MKVDLNKVTKEQLISVIATMHDTIQEWGNGYGLEKEDSDILIAVGSSCCSYCFQKSKFNEMDLILIAH